MERSSYLEKTKKLLPAVAILAVLAGVLATLAEEEKLDTSQIAKVEKKTKDSITDLFKPVQVDRSISRKEIPSFLKANLPEGVRLVREPENFDSTKQNFYIIAHKHYNWRNQHERSEDLASAQREAVEIFHLLRRIGVEAQLLEGVVSGMELKHDQKPKNLIDYPLKSMQEYKKSGEIRRAYVAVEGIYGSEIKSVGADIDFVSRKKVRDDYENAKRTFIKNTVPKLGTYFKNVLNLPSPFSRKDLFDAFNSLNLQEQNEIIEYIFSREGVKEYLSKWTNDYFFKQTLRNQKYIQTLNDKKLENKDVVFIVGAAHSLDLNEMATKEAEFNVFVIAESGISDELLNTWPINLTKEKALIVNQQKLLVNLGLRRP